ncbi:hypothetical protein FKM82_017526 [Ascaphus truei]
MMSLIHGGSRWKWNIVSIVPFFLLFILVKVRVDRNVLKLMVRRELLFLAGNLRCPNNLKEGCLKAAFPSFGNSLPLQRMISQKDALHYARDKEGNL